MSPKSSGFCMAHAQQCAGEVNKCYNDVKARVEQKTNVLKSKAQMFNANVGTLVARQEAILKQVTAQVNADSEFIKRFFPGANYTAPADLFVGMPETMGPNDPNNKYGVPIIGDLSKINELPGKIELLKNQLKEQKGKIQSVIKKYASEQNQAISQNQSKWKAFGAKCKATEKAFRQQMAAAEAQKQKDFAEKKAEVGDFCNRYNRLKNLSPTAGCGKVEDLYSDSNNIAAHLNGDVLGSLDAYSNICSGRDNGDDEDEDKTPKIKKMCDRYTWGQIKKQTLDNLLEKLPSDISQHRKKIKKHVEEGSPTFQELGSDVQNSDYADYIVNARELYKLKGQRGSSSSQYNRLASDMKNHIKNDENAKKKFEGLIDSFKSSQNKEQAEERINRLITKIEEGSSRDPGTTNGDNIKLLESAIDKLKGDATPTASQLELTAKFKGTPPATMNEKLKEYQTARDAYLDNSNPTSAQTRRFMASKNALADAMKSHVTALENNPFEDLLAEAKSAKEELSNSSERVPASEEGDDICANMDKEVQLVAEETCSDTTDGQSKCISDEITKLEVNEENGVNSKLRITKRADSILFSLDQGRGIASAQDWSAIGENSSDACESTAANGRNFGGLDLSEFDISTGAIPLGGVGSAQ